MNNQQVINLLKASITDMQTTIRSTDIKSGLLMTALVIPLANFKDLSYIYSTLSALTVKYPCGYWLLSVVFFLLCLCVLVWLFTLFSTLSVIFPSYKRALITDKEGIKLDCFFLGGITEQDKISFPDAIQHAREHLPASDDDVISVLLYEQIKLARLRARKLLRLKKSIISMGFFLFSILATTICFWTLVRGTPQ